MKFVSRKRKKVELCGDVSIKSGHLQNKKVNTKSSKKKYLITFSKD